MMQMTSDKRQATSDKKGYRNLIAWQKADNLAYEVYLVTKTFPKEEVYGITSQLRRAALSVPANIAEGFARQGKKEFKQFVNIALGSLAEVEYLLDFSLRLGYLNQVDYSRLKNIREEAGRLLWGFHKSLSRSLLAPVLCLLSLVSCRLLLFTCFLSLVSCRLTFANNLSVSDMSIASQDTTAHTATIQFDISWDNSARDGTNYDAAWVFIKYSLDAGATWKHATLKTSGTNPSGFGQLTGTVVDIVVPADKKGAFIQRNGLASGTLSATGVKFVWDYATDGCSDAAIIDLNTRIRIFGIEMVYMPTAAFSIGDRKVSSSDPAGGFFQANDTTNYTSFVISAESAITLGSNSSTNIMSRTGMDTQDDFTAGTTQTLPGTFPKGYNAFYLMKYEITQGQYVDFLNTLTRGQQKTRVEANVSTDTITSIFVMANTAGYVNASRNAITAPASGNGTTSPIKFITTNAEVGVSKNDRACNYLSWMDGAAFADWAALRPMSELEFERAARGAATPIADEYAWGNTTVTEAATISGTENGTETISTANANAHYSSATGLAGGDAVGDGPLRAGIFAASTSTRTQAGAGYYGNMELSGNVAERAVTVGNTAGRVFTGTHGDGVLSDLGNATNSDWPGYSSGEVSGAVGAAWRGGGWSDDVGRIRTSDRIAASLSANDTARYSRSGFRAARTAP